MSEQPASGAPRLTSQWILKAVLSAIAVLAAGILLMGIPGGLFLEAVRSLGLARDLPPDSVWPLAILITFVGGAMIAPVSLAWRNKRPDIVGWGHAWRTAVVTSAGTFLFTLLVAS